MNYYTVTTGELEIGEGGTGHVYFGRRYYDQETGVWTSPDPVVEFWNGYSYVGGRPLRLVDPKGLSSRAVSGNFNQALDKLTRGENIRKVNVPVSEINLLGEVVINFDPGSPPPVGDPEPGSGENDEPSDGGSGYRSSDGIFTYCPVAAESFASWKNSYDIPGLTLIEYRDRQAMTYALSKMPSLIITPAITKHKGWNAVIKESLKLIIRRQMRLEKE